MYKRLVIVALLLAVAVGLGYLNGKMFAYPLPGVSVGYVPQFIVLDMSAVVTGLRRVGADIAWIQLLQYYGTHESPVDSEVGPDFSINMTKYLVGIPFHRSKDDGAYVDEYQPQLEGGVYKDLLKYCYRVVELDPFFSYVYIYGAGALAWNLKRPDEALKLLRTGIISMERFQKDIINDHRQPYWQYNLYASAIMYRTEGDHEKMLKTLDVAAMQPGAPNLVKVILANLYEKEKQYRRSLALWHSVYETNDPQYTGKAERKIEEFVTLVKETQ